MARLIRESASRMVALINNMLDLARGRLGGGLMVCCDTSEPLEPVLREVIAELSVSYPNRTVETTIALTGPVRLRPSPRRSAPLQSSGQRARLWLPGSE
jgi:signal transduction histidine kinase